MIKNKNRFCRLIHLIGIVCIIVNIFLWNSFAVAKNSLKEGCDVMVYSLEHEVFQEFIKNPSRAILEDNGKGIMKDFAYSKKDIQAMLVKNSIVGEIEDIVVLNIRNMAVTIWLKINREDYFVTVDEKYDDYATRSDETAYIYRLYSYPDFYDEFKGKDTQLFVNSRNITAGNYVKIDHSGPYLPLRAVMESLGAIVDWDEERRAVLLLCKGVKYVYDMDKSLLRREGDDRNLLIIPPGGIYRYCHIINDRIIMNDNMIQVFVNLMGAKIRVNYDDFIIEINQ